MKYDNFRYKKHPLMASLALAALVLPTSGMSAATLSDPTVTTLTANSSFSIDAAATDFYIFGENVKKKGGPAAFTDVSATALSNVSTSAVKVVWSGGDPSDSTGSTKYDAVKFGSSFNPHSTEAKFTLTMPSTDKGEKISVTVNNVSGANGWHNIGFQAAQFITTVVKQNQTITFGTLSNKIVSDTPFDLQATASSKLPVTYTTTGACTLDNGKIKIIGAGDCTITASQAGNNSYNAAPNVTQTFKISKATQTVSFTDPPTHGTVDKTVALSVQASSGLTDITLTSTSDVCTVSNRQVTFKAAGTCKITASQAGNANYQAAQASLDILVANTATINQLTNKTVGDAGFSFNAQSTAGLPVELTLDPQSQGICTLDGTLVTPIGIGTCIIHAFQPGNATTNPAQAEYHFDITGEPQEQTLSVQFMLNEGIVGDVLSIMVMPGESGNAVTLASATSEVCQVQESSATLLKEGICTVTAKQAGNQQYLEASASSSVTVKTDKATFNLAVSSNKNNSGQLTEVSQADTVNIDLKITAAPRDVGKTVEAYLTAKLNGKQYILTEQGWDEWEGKKYQRAKSMTLDAQAQTIPAFSGQFPFTGTLEFFAAYGSAGVVAQGPQAVGNLSVTPMNPVEQAKADCLETGGIYYAQKCFTDVKELGGGFMGGIYVEGQANLQMAANLPCRLGNKVAVLVRFTVPDADVGKPAEFQLDFQLENNSVHKVVKTIGALPKIYSAALFEGELPTIGTLEVNLGYSVFNNNKIISGFQLPTGLTLSARFDSCDFSKMQLNTLPLGSGKGEVMTKINDDGSVRLTAILASEGGVFAGWAGDADGCKGGETMVTIKPTANKFTCQPTFNKQVLGTLNCVNGFDSEQNIACCDLNDPKCPTIPEPCNPPKETEAKWIVNVPAGDTSDTINIRITNLADQDNAPIKGTLYDADGKAIFEKKELVEAGKMAAFQTVRLTLDDLMAGGNTWTGRAILKIEAPDISRLSVISLLRGKGNKTGFPESPLMNMTPYTTKHRVFHIPPQSSSTGADSIAIRIANIGVTPMIPVIRLFDASGQLLVVNTWSESGIASLATLRIDSDSLTDWLVSKGGTAWKERSWAEIVPADVAQRCNGKMLIQSTIRQRNIPFAPLSNITPVNSQ